jgi:hypothetical protein
MLGIGFGFGQWSASRAEPTPAGVVHEQAPWANSNVPTASASRLRQAPRQADPEEPPVGAAGGGQLADGAESAEREWRTRQATSMLNAMRGRVARAERFAVGGHEATANEVREYTQGWMEALATLQPDIIGELAAGIEGRLCAAEASAVESIVMSRVLATRPDLANAKGLDCVFSRHEEQEDIVLWSALDAWQRAKLPVSESLAAIKSNARDSRTLRRLVPLDQQRAERHAQHGSRIPEGASTATAESSRDPSSSQL